jgi:hypothetical protein
MKVRSLVTHAAVESQQLISPQGARHLYMMDLSGENLPNLKSTIEERYPDVTVRTPPSSSPQPSHLRLRAGHCHSSRCGRRQSHFGRLPPGTQRARQTGHLLRECACSTFYPLTPRNSLPYPGWHRSRAHDGRDVRRDVYQHDASKYTLVSTDLLQRPCTVPTHP